MILDREINNDLFATGEPNNAHNGEDLLEIRWDPDPEGARGINDAGDYETRFICERSGKKRNI